MSNPPPRHGVAAYFAQPPISYYCLDCLFSQHKHTTTSLARIKRQRPQTHVIIGLGLNDALCDLRHTFNRSACERAELSRTSTSNSVRLRFPLLILHHCTTRHTPTQDSDESLRRDLGFMLRVGGIRESLPLASAPPPTVCG